jgi:hypothetical protein
MLDERCADAGVPWPWGPAVTLADAGYDLDDLSGFVTLASGSDLDGMLRWLASVASSHRLLRGILSGNERVPKIVEALKGYRAPWIRRRCRTWTSTPGWRRHS